MRVTARWGAFREDEGGGEHCHEGTIAWFHQCSFDWLDGVLGI